MFKAGDNIGKFTVVRSLGSGGMADVYEAEDTGLGRRVALKVLPPELTRNKQLIQRFEKEVRAAASLNHHGIVTVFEVGETDGLHYYSMRMLTGGDLRARMDAGLTPIEALAILRELADAFAHAHSRGFVHRDVKPENVIFDEQGYPVLTDFGIAKAVNSGTRVTATGVSVGTPRYISPEQARGRAVDARADLYSLGVILYEMLTGKPPFEGEESLAVIFQHVTEPIPRLPDEHAALQPLVDALMAKDPEERPESAEALMALIDRHLPQQRAPSTPGATQENPLVAKLITPSPLRTPGGTRKPLPTVESEQVERERREQEDARQKEKAAREKAEAEQRRREEEAQEQAELQRREEVARKQAEEEQRRQEEVARAAVERQRQEEERRQAEQQRREEEAQKQAELQRRKEEEARRAAEEKRQRELAKQQQREEAARKKAEQQRLREAETQRREEAARVKAEARRKAEEETRQRKAEEARRQAELAAQRRAERERQREADRQRKAAANQQHKAERQRKRAAAIAAGKHPLGLAMRTVVAAGAALVAVAAVMLWPLRPQPGVEIEVLPPQMEESPASPGEVAVFPGAVNLAPESVIEESTPPVTDTAAERERRAAEEAALLRELERQREAERLSQAQAQREEAARRMAEQEAATAEEEAPEEERGREGRRRRIPGF